MQNSTSLVSYLTATYDTAYSWYTGTSWGIEIQEEEIQIPTSDGPSLVDLAIVILGIIGLAGAGGAGGIFLLRRRGIIG